MIYDDGMTNNTAEEKSPVETSYTDKLPWQEDPLPEVVHFRQGWSITMAFILGFGVIIGQLIINETLSLPLINQNNRVWHDLVASIIFIISGISGAVAILLLWRAWLLIGRILAAFAIMTLGAGISLYDHHNLPVAVDVPNQPVEVTLIITESQHYRKDRQQIKAQIAPHDPLHELMGNYLVRLIIPQQIEPLYPGFHIRAEVDFQPLLPQLLPGGFDFTGHALRQNIIAGGFVRAVVSIEDKGNYPMARLRRSFQEKIYAIMDKDWAAPIASALLPGLRASIPSELREMWRGAGLAHLLAISGLHMMLVCGMIMVSVRLIMSLFPKYSSYLPSFRIAAIIALPLSFFYLLFAGTPVSALRAFIMLALALIAIIMSRRGITLHHVALAAIIILISSPSSLFGPAFQMSFSAVFALVVAWNIWLRRRLSVSPSWVMRLWWYFVGIALSSVIASLASMPFALYHFGITTSWSVLANIIGMPLMGLVIMPMGVMGMLLSPLGMETLPLHIMNVGIISLSYVAGHISSFEGARLAIFPPSSLITFMLAIAILIIGVAPGKWQWASGAVLLIAISLWWISPRPVAGIILNYGKPVLAVLSRDGYLLLSTPNTDGFAGQILAQPFGRSTSDYIRDHDGQSGVYCENESCYIPTTTGQVIAMIWSRSDLTKACQKADIILAQVRASYPCRDGSILLDWDDLKASGGMLIYGSHKTQDSNKRDTPAVTIRQVNTSE